MTYFILILGVLLIILPLYVTVVTAFKSNEQSAQSFFSLPIPLYLESFKEILLSEKYYRALMNTVYITAIVLLGNVLIMPAMSYAVARRMPHSRWYRYVYFFLLLGIFIPFQVKMMPLVKMLSSLEMMNRLVWQFYVFPVLLVKVCFSLWGIWEQFLLTWKKQHKLMVQVLF